MGGNLPLIASGFDLAETHIADAIGSREETRALLGRLSIVSAPGTGIAKVLLVYARMATMACEWLDGDLCVDLVGEGENTAIHTFTELGGGLRERLFPPLPFRAPLAEFARSIKRAPYMISPLVMRSTTPRRVRLSASELVARTTLPPPLIAISAESLFLRVASRPVPEDEGPLSPPLPIVMRAAVEAPTPPSYDSKTSLVGSSTEGAVRRLPGSPSEPPLSDVDGGWDDED